MSNNNKVSQSPFIETHRYYYFEKYYSIFSEFSNLFGIMLVYKNKEILDTHLIDTAKNIFKDLKSQYETLKEKEFNTIVYDFLIDLDYEREQLENILARIELLHEKVTQVIFESSSHIHPLPPIQKRYSSKILSSLLEEHHELLVDTLISDNEKHKIFSIWSHNESYSIPNLDGKSHYSRHSFYYHDIASTIPSIIDHEVILKSIKYNTTIQEIIDDFKNSIFEKIEETLNEKKNEYNEFEQQVFFYEYKGFFKSNLEPILQELASDYIGYYLYGDHYLLGFFHETLGKFFGHGFYEEGVRTNHINMGVNPQRDALLLRQFMVSNFREKDTSSIRLIKEGNYRIQLQLMLQQILLPKDSVSFYDWMSSQSSVDEGQAKQIGSDQDTAGQYIEIMQDISPLLMDYIEKISEKINIIIPNSKADKLKKKSPFFNNNSFDLLSLWTEREKCIQKGTIPHRSILRKKLLQNIGYEGTCEPYILTYHYSNSTEHADSTPITFGSHNAISIVAAPTDINLTHKIDEKITNMGTKFPKEDDVEIDNNSNFETKHALLMLQNDKPTEIKDKPYSVYMLIHVKEEYDQNRTLKLSETISDELKKLKIPFNIYKSFGPEDLVIEVGLNKDEDIWNLIEDIRKNHSEYIHETFSNIITKNKTFSDKTWIKSLYRTTPDIDFDTFYNLANTKGYRTELNNDTIQIFNVADKFYDFEVWWHKVDLEKINNFSKVLDQSLITSEHFMLSSDKLDKKNIPPTKASPKGH